MEDSSVESEARVRIRVTELPTICHACINLPSSRTWTVRVLALRGSIGVDVKGVGG